MKTPLHGSFNFFSGSYIFKCLLKNKMSIKAMDPSSFLFAKKIILVILLFKKCKNTSLTFMNLKMTIVSL